MSAGLNDEVKKSQINTESNGSPEKVRLQGRLTTPVIIILVMAMLAPISGFCAILPLGIGLGNGAGLPASPPATPPCPGVSKRPARSTPTSRRDWAVRPVEPVRTSLC